MAKKLLDLYKEKMRKDTLIRLLKIIKEIEENDYSKEMVFYTLGQYRELAYFLWFNDLITNNEKMELMNPHDDIYHLNNN